MLRRRGSWPLLVLGFLTFALASCGRKRAVPAPTPTGVLCSTITVTALPSDTSGYGYGVELPVDGAVLRKHRARLEKLGITPNGEAWAGILTQCDESGALVRGRAMLDPEASSLHAWARDESAASSLKQAMCRAVDDDAWLDACLARLDRSALDD